MYREPVSRLNAIERQREALRRHEMFATLVSFWATVCNALSYLTELSTAGNPLVDPLVQTPEIRKQLCRRILHHLAVVIPFSFLAAQIGEAVESFLCATIRSETFPAFVSMTDNIIDASTMQRWHALFHQILSEVCTQFRWVTRSLEDAEADLIIANAGLRFVGNLPIEDGQTTDTEVDSD